MMPFVIFSDDKRYWEFFKDVCDIFEQKQREIVYWTCSKDDPALEADYKYVKAEYIGNINAASVRLNRMRAGICIATTPGLDVYQWKRSKDTRWYVHVMHGAGDARGYKMFGLDFFDAVLVAGEHQVGQIRQIEKLRNEAEKEIEVVGEPHIDKLYARYLKECGKVGKKADRTVLLAPSWGKSGILAKYGSRILDALIATGYKVVVRPHPQTRSSEKEMLDELMKKYPENDSFKWNFDNDNFDVLNAADIMITDFSGVIWDYTYVFDKPVIYTETEIDESQYDNYWTGEKRWPVLTLERIGIKLREEDFGRMKEVIDDAVNSKEIKTERDKVRSESWGNPGHSAEKIADYLFKKYETMDQEAVAS